MKNLSSFEAFKLNKVQMSVVKGGVQCTIDFGDGDILLTKVHSDLDAAAAEKALKESYQDIASVSCS